MDPSTVASSVDNLDPGQECILRVITFRTFTVPLGRRKRALEDDENVGISATVSYVTCPEGREGLNCENEMPTTLEPTEPAVVTKTSSESVTPWELIVIALSVALTTLLIILVTVLCCIQHQWRRLQKSKEDHSDHELPTPTAPPRSPPPSYANMPPYVFNPAHRPHPPPPASDIPPDSFFHPGRQARALAQHHPDNQQPNPYHRMRVVYNPSHQEPFTFQYNTGQSQV